MHFIQTNNSNTLAHIQVKCCTEENTKQEDYIPETKTFATHLDINFTLAATNFMGKPCSVWHLESNFCSLMYHVNSSCTYHEDYTDTKTNKEKTYSTSMQLTWGNLCFASINSL